MAGLSVFNKPHGSFFSLDEKIWERFVIGLSTIEISI